MADKKTCFVMIPFNPCYTQLYDRIYKPAIEAAGLTPRLAGGPGVDDLIADIEDGIRNSLLCFVDISEDNPNVWYEFGFAHASGKSVAKVCDKGKRPEKLPFDISVKNVMFYNEHHGSDDMSRDGFQRRISKDLEARVAKATAALKSAVAPVEGSTVAASSQNSEESGNDNIQLDADEIKVMGIILHYGHALQNRYLFEETDKMMSRVPAQLALDGLYSKGLIQQMEEEYQPPWYITTDFGKSWCHKNKHIFLATADNSADNSKPADNFSDMDDVPF